MISARTHSIYIDLRQPLRKVHIGHTYKQRKRDEQLLGSRLAIPLNPLCLNRRGAGTMPILGYIMVLALAIAALALSGNSTTAEEEVRVLFVGNSYSHQHNVPGQVEEIGLAKDGAPILYKTALVADYGVNLITYMNDQRVVQLLDQEDWDVIVLQDLSTAALHPRRSVEFDQAVGWFSAQAENEGARLILFQTWPRRAGHWLYSSAAQKGFMQPHDPDDMLKVVSKAYADAARKYGATIAPVGQCWLGSSDPKVLYAWDGSHASKDGAALTARVLERAISGQDVMC